ncbi:MAG: radical SAM protein [Bacteroidales bacterium]|nr:radical SAM protein [Bacteroidales bacterium]
MRKLLLVSANQMKAPYPVYPLGVSYLYAYLNTHLENFEIKIFDFIDKNEDDYISFLRKYKPDYVGVSLRNIDDVNVYIQESFIQHYKTIVDNTRTHSDAIVIIGGSGYSIFPELLFRRIQPNFGIYGEGEVRFKELLTALDTGESYSHINNLLFTKEDKLVFNKGEQTLKNFNLCFNPAMADFYWQHSGMLNIQTKRGCPYKCIYCTYPVIESHKVRTLNKDNIIDVLEDLSKNREIDYLFFTDSIFNLDNKFNYELAENIIRKGIKINWGAYFNFCNLDEGLLRLLQKAGLKHIEFGTDSLSEAMLENYNKPFGLTDIFRISDICVKLGIDYAHFLILAGYGETEDTIDETFLNSKRLEKTVFFPFIGLRIYPGTRLYEIALKEGRIKSEDDLLLPVYYLSDKVNIKQLKEKAAKTNKRWIFPDDDLSVIMNKMRTRNKKGPLWEYLIQ